MIVVEINEANFEYDIHSLVKAFYPKEDVVLRTPEHEPDNSEGEILFTMQVQLEPNRIAVRLVQCSEDDFSDTADITGCDRKETKNRLKQLIYRILSRKEGRTLPWGTLTGIRPTKIPMAFLERGESDEAIAAYMKETYYASDEKIRLGTEIAHREKQLLNQLDYVNGYSLYIGIPFCPTTCLYCSFTSYPIARFENIVDDYLSALFKEMEAAARMMHGRKPDTIYIGGGTPTTLSPEQLKRLIDKICETFDISSVLEFTVEGGRPDSITKEKLQTLYSLPVTRISINPQTMQQKTLDLIGRRHTVEDTVRSFYMAREIGFDNINMDLIVGLPDETVEDVADTLRRIEELKPDNLTVHSLALKRAARLSMNYEQYKELSISNTSQIMDMTAECAKNLSMNPYYLYRQKNMAGNFENVGYATEGKAGIYNILIMEEKQTIVALGAGATTKYVSPDGQRIERAANVKDIQNYLDRIDEMIERKREIIG